MLIVFFMGDDVYAQNNYTVRTQPLYALASVLPKLNFNIAAQNEYEEQQQNEPIVVNIADTIALPPVLEHISQYRPYDRTRVLRKEKGALYVHFPVDKVELRRDFRDNAATLDRIVEITRQLLADSTSSLSRIQIVGLASIEGGVQHNEDLAANRAQALKQYVLLQVPQATDSLFDVASGGEAWAELRDQVNDEIIEMETSGVEADGARLKGLRDALDIIDSEADLTRREQRLRLLRQGTVFNYIKTNFLANQRNSCYLHIYYDQVPDTVTKPVTPPPFEPVIPVATVDEIVPVLLKEPRRELLSVKTNLLFYGIYMPGYNRYCPIPNVAVEYYPKRGHFTFGGSFDMPWWQDYWAHKYFQLRNYQLETRYYLKGSKPYQPNKANGTNGSYKAPAFRGLYFQAYVHAGLFGICFDANRGWVGEGFGAGVGLGYVVPISKNGHWRLEFAAQGGFFTCKYDPYQFENPVNPDYRDHLYYYKWTQKPQLFKKRQYRWNWVGPTRVGVTLSYDLLYRRIKKKGASFRAYERTWVNRTYKANEANRAYEPKEERRANP